MVSMPGFKIASFKAHARRNSKTRGHHNTHICPTVLLLLWLDGWIYFPFAEFLRVLFGRR